MMALHYTDKDMEEQALLSFSEERVILFSESGLERTGFSVGDRITLTGGAGQNEYQIVGSFKSRATDVEAVISSAYAVSDFGASVYGFLAYTAADPDAVMVQIRDLFGETSNWSRTVEEFNADALSTVGAFLQPMHSMTYFILLLAAVGIINNLLINYMQKRRSTAMYKSVGLSNRRRHTPRELSGGQQQRVAIARALIGSPEILFADEPTGNLDSRTGAEIMKLLREINQGIGQTIIMVTHSPEAAGNSTRMITVQDGRVLS